MEGESVIYYLLRLLILSQLPGKHGNTAITFIVDPTY